MPGAAARKDKTFGKARFLVLGLVFRLKGSECSEPAHTRSFRDG
jgi:hypothetical protein